MLIGVPKEIKNNEYRVGLTPGSVREVIDAVNRVNGTPIKVREEPRRPGDPPALIAKADRARSVLGWEPRHDDLDFIVKTSLDWERKLVEQTA